MNDATKTIALHMSLCKKLEASFPIVINSLSRSKFKYTSKALVSFVPKSGHLTNLILLAYGSKDPYSASILFRSLIDHTFKHLYIYVKALNDDSDLVGEEYYHSLKGHEDLNSIVKINNYTKVVHPEKTNKWSTKSEHNNKISEIAKQFDISKIFYYLIENNNNEKDEIIKKYKKEYF